MVSRPDSRRQTQDSPRTRSSTNAQSPPKPTPKKSQNSLPSNGQPSSKLPDRSQSSSASSSDSESDPESDSHVYVLHRHLDFRHLNQHIPHSGFDVFTSRKWNLSRDRLKAFAELKDTDLVQLHYPVPVNPPPPKKLTLADIAPPLNPSASTSKPPLTALASSSAPTIPSKPRLTKVCPDSLSGPSVPSLYYSPYSSFAPSYDSTGTSQTYEQARMAYLSKARIQSWVQRPKRYATVAPEPEPKPVSEAASVAEKEKPVGPTTRRRKRQKITASTDPSPPPPKEPTPPPTREEVQRTIGNALEETSKLIMNLQERQFERLRATQQAHLDPLLSAHAPVSSVPERPRGGGDGPDREEMAEAAELMKRLSKLIALRPRLDPSHLDSDACMSDVEAEECRQLSLAPSTRAIRRSYAMLTESSQDFSSNAPYNGDLPVANPIGISETTLTTEPNPRLISILKRTLEPGPSHGTSSHGGVGSSPAIRDPALLGPRAQATMGVGADKTNGVNGLVSKLAGASYGVSQSGLTNLQQQQQLQAQRILAGSPFKSRPSVTGMGVGGIGGKVMGTTGNATVTGTGLSEHPNHRALAGKIGQAGGHSSGVINSNSSSNNHTRLAR